MKKKILRRLFYFRKFGLLYSVVQILGKIKYLQPFCLYQCAEIQRRYYQKNGTDMAGEIAQLYKAITGKDIDINNPETINEKIQWIKAYDITFDKIEMSDKVIAKEKIALIVGKDHVIPLIGIYDDCQSIDFEKMPLKYVIKSSQGSNFCIVVDGKKSISPSHIRRVTKWWLKTDFAYLHMEKQYEKRLAKIIVEKYIDMNEYDEYKFMCFDGMPQFFWVRGEENGVLTRDFFDMEWERINFGFGEAPRNTNLIKPDINLYEEVVEAVKKLCKKYRFVRVDTYVGRNNYYIGELTFTSGAGYDDWKPLELDKHYGAMISTD